MLKANSILLTAVLPLFIPKIRVQNKLRGRVDKRKQERRKEKKSMKLTWFKVRGELVLGPVTAGQHEETAGDQQRVDVGPVGISVGGQLRSLQADGVVRALVQTHIKPVSPATQLRAGSVRQDVQYLRQRRRSLYKYEASVKAVEGFMQMWVLCEERIKIIWIKASLN